VSSDSLISNTRCCLRQRSDASIIPHSEWTMTGWRCGMVCRYLHIPRPVWSWQLQLAALAGADLHFERTSVEWEALPPGFACVSVARRVETYPRIIW